MSTCSTARVACERPGRYARQMASHFSRKIETRWDSDERRGYLYFDGINHPLTGEVELIAGDGVLLMQAESFDGSIEALERLIGILMVRFAKRDDVEVSWIRQGGSRGTKWTTANLTG